MRLLALLVAVLLASSLSPLAGATPEDLPQTGTRTCGGVAPAVTDCTTGTRLPMASQMELVAASDFTGHLFTEMRTDTGGFGTVCSFESGIRGTCLDYGRGLPAMDLVLARHVCGALDSDGDPGGSGSWSCSVRDRA